MVTLLLDYWLGVGHNCKILFAAEIGDTIYYKDENISSEEMKPEQDEQEELQTIKKEYFGIFAYHTETFFSFGEPTNQNHKMTFDTSTDLKTVDNEIDKANTFDDNSSAETMSKKKKKKEKEIKNRKKKSVRLGEKCLFFII